MQHIQRRLQRHHSAALINVRLLHNTKCCLSTFLFSFFLLFLHNNATKNKKLHSGGEKGKRKSYRCLSVSFGKRNNTTQCFPLTQLVVATPPSPSDLSPIGTPHKRQWGNPASNESLFGNPEGSHPQTANIWYLTSIIWLLKTRASAAWMSRILCQTPTFM